MGSIGPQGDDAGSIRGKRLIWWLTATGCALFAVDDVTLLRSLGGGLLASPGWVPILVAGWLASRNPRFKGLRLTRVLAVIFFYGALITLLTLPFVATDLLGESPVAKSVKFLLSVGVWLLLLVSGAILSRVVPKAIQIGSATAIFLMVAGAVLYHVGSPVVDQNVLIHSYQNLQQRVRSTRFEASSLGSGLIVCLGLIAMQSRRKIGVVGYSVGLLLVGLVAESRGTTLTIVLTLLVVPFAVWMQSMKASLSARTVRLCASVVAVLAIVLSFRLDYFLGGPLWVALGLKTAGTSDASRSMWADTSLAALGQHPFGMGYAAYLEWLPKLIENSARSAADQFPLRDLSEMIHLSSAVSDAELSPKNLVGIAAVHLGIVGIIAVMFLYSAMIKNSIYRMQPDASVRLVVSVALIIVSSTYYTSIFSMDQAFLMGALVWGGGRLAKVSDSSELNRHELKLSKTKH